MLSAAELITLADRSMPGFERANLGDWTLRSAIGSTGRANSALPIGDPGHATVDAVAAVESWYAERSHGATFQIFESAGALGPELTALGYSASDLSEVRVASLAEVRLGDPGSAMVHESIPAALGAMVGDPDRTREITSTSLTKLVAVVEGDGGEPIGCGMVVVDGTAAGVFAMRTATEAWGQGVGSMVFAALAKALGERGVTDLWLQVEQANTRAVEWYDRIGFQHVDSYRYWRRSAP